MNSKNPIVSKTIWVNGLAILAVILNGQFGIKLSPEVQVAALAVINFVLRLVTKAPLNWGKNETA